MLQCSKFVINFIREDRIEKVYSFNIYFYFIYTAFTNGKCALAQDLTQSLVDDIKVSKQDGSTGEFRYRDRAKITVNFSQKNGTKIQPNDTITVNLPPELVGFSKTFDITNNDGKVLGKCVVQNGQIICTFNDNVKDLQNVRGEFYFEAEINKADEGKHDVNLIFGNTNINRKIVVNNPKGVIGESNEIFFKSGQIVPSDVNTVHWAIRFNNKQDYFRANDPAIIKDTLGDGTELIADSFQFSVWTKGQKDKMN